MCASLPDTARSPPRNLATSRPRRRQRPPRLETLFDRLITSVGDMQHLTRTSFAAANQLVARLTDLGIVREITGYSRNRRFRYDPYVRLFVDEPEDTG
jgi:hypothetical protein